MLKKILISISILLNSSSAENLDIIGTYSAIESNGYLEINEFDSNNYVVNLKIDGGSCAGAKIIDNEILIFNKNKIISKSYIDINNKTCEITVDFSDKDFPVVQDSCLSKEEEELSNTTCTYLGKYN